MVHTCNPREVTSLHPSSPTPLLQQPGCNLEVPGPPSGPPTSQQTPPQANTRHPKAQAEPLPSLASFLRGRPNPARLAWPSLGMGDPRTTGWVPRLLRGAGPGLTCNFGFPGSSAGLGAQGAGRPKLCSSRDGAVVTSSPSCDPAARTAALRAPQPPARPRPRLCGFARRGCTPPHRPGEGKVAPRPSAVEPVC